MTQSSKLLNFHESYVLAGFPMTKIYTELNTNVKTGDKVFIVGGSYDTYTLGMGVGDPYAQYADGYDVLHADDNNNFIVIDYPYDANKDIYSTIPVNGCKEAYLSTSYFRSGEFNNGSFNDGIIGQNKFVDTTTTTQFLNVGPNNYIVMDQTDFESLNNTGLGKISENDRILVQYSRIDTDVDYDGIYTVNQIIPPLVSGITGLTEYAFKVNETLTNNFLLGVEIQRTNSVTFGNGVGIPKIYHAIWHGGKYNKGLFDSKTDYYSGYTFKKAEVNASVVNVQTLSTTNTNNFGLGYNMWLSGLFVSGEWKNGIWEKGVWLNGNFRKGNFNGGLWLNGTKDAGEFSSINSYVRWYNGTHTSGKMIDILWENGTFNGGDWYGAKNYKIQNIDLITISLNQHLRIWINPEHVKRFVTDSVIMISYLKTNNGFKASINNDDVNNPTMQRYTVDYTDSYYGYIVLKQIFTGPLPIFGYTNAVISNSYFLKGVINDINWKSGLLWSGYSVQNFNNSVSGSLTFECIADVKLPNKNIIKTGDVVFLANYQYSNGINNVNLANVPLTVTNVSSAIFSTPPVLVTVSINPLAQGNTSYINLYDTAFVNKSKWVNGNFYSGRMLGTNFRSGNVYAQLETLTDTYLTFFEKGWWTETESNAIGPNVTWYDGVFEKGVFTNGDWKNGIFEGKFFANYKEHAVLPTLQYSARWYDGIIKGTGEWYYGEFLNGTIESTIWHDGIVNINQYPLYIQHGSQLVSNISTTENFVSMGKKIFIVEDGLDYVAIPTQLIRISPTDITGKYMEGTIDSYIHNELTVNITTLGSTGNVGIYNNWNVSQYHKYLEFSDTDYYWRKGMTFSLLGSLIGDDVTYTVRDIYLSSGNTRIITTIDLGLSTIPTSVSNNTVTINYNTESVNIFQNGTWQNGTWQNGSFNNGAFNGGTWQNGSFNGGTFNKGTWLNGTFNGGNMNGVINPINWSNGVIKNGIFTQIPFQNIIAKGGTFEKCVITKGYFDGGILNNSTFYGDGVHNSGNSLEFNDGVANNSICDGGILNGGLFNSGLFLGSNGTGPSLMTNSGHMIGTVLDGISGLSLGCKVIGGIMENVIVSDKVAIERGEFKSGTYNSSNISSGIFGGDGTQQFSGAFSDGTNFDTLFQDQSIGGTAFYLAKTDVQPFTNGDFSMGLTGWTAMGGGSWTSSSNNARFDFTGNVISELVVASTPLTNGVNYMVSIKIVSNNNPLNLGLGVSVRIIAGTSNNFLLKQTSPGIYSGPVLADSNNFRIQIVTNFTSIVTDYIIIDDVICKPINNTLPLASWLQSPTPELNYTANTSPYIWCSNINENGNPLYSKCRIIAISTTVNNGWVQVYHKNTYSQITKKISIYNKFPISGSVWNTGNFNGGTFSSIWRDGVAAPSNNVVQFINAIWEGGTCGKDLNSPSIEVTGLEILENGDFSSGPGVGWAFGPGASISNFFTNIAFSYYGPTTSTTLLTLPINANISASGLSPIIVGSGPSPLWSIVVASDAHFKIGGVVKVISNNNPQIWVRGIVTTYNAMTLSLMLRIIEKNCKGNTSDDNWTVQPEEIALSGTDIVSTMTNNKPLVVGKYYKFSTLGIYSQDIRNYVKIKMGTSEHILNGISNTSNQIIPKSFLMKANGTTFTIDMISRYTGSIGIYPISVKEISVPYMLNSDWISGHAYTVEMVNNQLDRSIFINGTIDQGIFDNINIKSGTFNYSKMNNCDAVGINFYDGLFTGTSNNLATMNNSIIHSGVFSRGRLDSCNSFLTGLFLTGQMRDGSCGGTFNGFNQFAMGDVTWSNGYTEPQQKAVLQFTSLTLLDTPGSTIVIAKNYSPILTITASINYAPHCYPSTGWSPSNWGANQPAVIASAIRSGANWSTDPWQVILRDVLEYELQFVNGQPSAFLVQFGENRYNVINTNYGEGLEQNSVYTKMYITTTDAPTTPYSYTKDPSSTTSFTIASQPAKVGTPQGRIINDKWTDVLADIPNSTDNLSLGIGQKTFTGLDALNEASNYANVDKTRVVARVYSKADPTKFMVGRVITYITGSTSITIDVYYASATGSYSDWMIQLYYSPRTNSACSVSSQIVSPGDPIA